MQKKHAVRFTGLIATAGLAMSLAACGGSQSVADACNIVETEMKSVNAEMQTALTESMSGENADVAAAFDPIVAGLDKVLKDVSNDEVKEATQGMRDVVADFAKSMGDMGVDFSDPEALADPATMEKLEELTEKMEAQTTELQAAGEKLDNLCNTK